MAVIDLIFDFSNIELGNMKLSAQSKIFFWHPNFLFLLLIFPFLSLILHNIVESDSLEYPFWVSTIT